MAEPIEFAKKVAKISNDFEQTNTELKRQYIVSNIMLYNTIGSLIKECMGTFGTGYPFYVLDKNLKGALPVIDEQIRYNNELITHADNSKFKEWRCARCLEEQKFTMPDLKQICKTCPGMEDVLKPRKLINRLPDLDLWMVASKSDIQELSAHLAQALAGFGFKTSDVDPVKTIYELESIVSDLKNNKMPKSKLPIDTHIIDNVTLYTLIGNIPDVLDHCYRHDSNPYLPIHPLSLRKTWQQDDSAYNFVHDYLSSFSEFEMDESIQNLLNETRKEIAKKYSLDTLYKFLIQTGPESVARRHKNPELKEAFEKRIESWREL